MSFMIWKDFPNLGRAGRIDYLTMQDGTRLRTASWPSRSDDKGIVVVVNGYREFMEKYCEFFSDILGRGFALYALDNRGQGLSDRLVPDKTKSHAENFELFSNDLNEFISTAVMADSRAQELPLYLMAHSMGGHVCLRYLHDFPAAVSKAVIMAPMIEFNLGGFFASIMTKFIIRSASVLGLKEIFAMGQGNVLSENMRFIKQKLLTHDNNRYAMEAEMIRSSPELYVGGATYGWLSTALDSIEKINEPGYLNKINIPVLVALAGSDVVVNSQAGRELLAGYDNFTVITIEGSRHEIYREIDKYRNQLWQQIDDFLK